MIQIRSKIRRSMRSKRSKSKIRRRREMRMSWRLCHPFWPKGISMLTVCEWGRKCKLVGIPDLVFCCTVV
jgi:hypothetical protein